MPNFGFENLWQDFDKNYYVVRTHYILYAEYDENPKNESTSSSAIISDLLKRSASFRFPDTGHSSIKSLKKKFQEAW